MIASVLLLAALCLPPGVPPLESLHPLGRQAYMVETESGTEKLVVAILFADSQDHHVVLHYVDDLLAAVDDAPQDETDTNWWIDPSVVTDTVPAKLRDAPTQSCQWRRRVQGQKT